MICPILCVSQEVHMKSTKLRHEWGTVWCKWDLIVTTDDATNEYYDIFFVDQESSTSSFPGVKTVVAS